MGSTYQEKSEEKKVKISLDELMKLMFESEDEIVINYCNHFFQTKLSMKDKLKIDFINTEFSNLDDENLYADLLFKIVDQKDNMQFYHMEFQTKNHRNMARRMFEYANIHANKQARIKGNQGKLKYPEQLVLFLEKNRNIKGEHIEVSVVLSKQNVLVYKILIGKVWEYDIKKIHQYKLYPLIPLLVLPYRKRLSSLKQNGKTTEQEHESIKRIQKELRNKIRDICSYVEVIAKVGLISSDYSEKVMKGIVYFIDYYEMNYGIEKEYVLEVQKMIREIFDPQIKEMALEEGKAIGLREGKAIGLREGEATGLRKGEAKTLKETILLILDNKNVVDFEIEKNISNINDIALLKRILLEAISNNSKEVLLSKINTLVKNEINVRF